MSASPDVTSLSPRPTPPASRRRRDTSKLLARIERHPFWTVLLLAVLARAAAVVALGPLREGVNVPDEQQYLELAESVASGRGAEAWQPGYGQFLYDSTAAFMRPLALATRFFGEHQVVGQLLAATFGVITALLTTWLALRVVRPRFAAVAAGVVALLPSQVYWSSIVLRESMVWAALAALGLAFAVAARSRAWRVLAACAGVVALALWALSDLRGQTAFVACVALLLAAFIVRSARRAAVATATVSLVLIVPWGAGLGPGGYTFVETALPRLAVIRTNLSIGAESSFVDPLPAPPPRDAAPATSPRPGTAAAAPTPVPSASASSAPVAGPSEPGGYVVDETPGASLAALPRGLVAVTLRPFPWEPARNVALLFAAIENLGWVVLYVLAAVGAFAGWRRRDALAFPFLVTGGILVVAAVSQANLGTAFRHRGQVLWALSVLAVVGLQHLVDARRRPSPDAV